MSGVSLKAVYGVTELATLAGVSRHQMRRMLAASGLDLPSRGERKKLRVPLDAFKTALPELWESILTRVAVAEATARSERSARR